MPGFLTSLTEKAQAAVNASPLAAHLPTSMRASSPDPSSQPGANTDAAQPASNATSGGGHRSHLVDSLQYQIRAFGQAYSSSTTPVQKIVTAQKGVAIDFDSVSRDVKENSKNLYTWGQQEDEDIKDVTDRLAFLNFVQGSLASSLALKLDASRAPLKALRDAEAALLPRRNIRAGLQLQLSRIAPDQKGAEKRITELKDQIRKAEHDDESQEKEIDLLKRKAIKDSEELKWEAIREYAEKLVLLSQASTPVLAALPSVPPSASSPYTGTQATGAARASLQRALDNYKTGHINLTPTATSDLSRSDTRSFGESHASELSTITADASHVAQPNIPMTPPPAASSPKLAPTASGSINPSHLNLSPAPIPSHPASSPSVQVAPVSSDPTAIITPTVAETGVPISSTGPGPASGSLHDIKAASPTRASQPSFGSQSAQDEIKKPAPKFESAEEEKKRLAQYSAPSGPPPPSSFYPPPTHPAKLESAEEEKKRLAANYSASIDQPSSTTSTTAAPSATAASSSSAEDEKKRLEREERERILNNTTTSDVKKEDELPAYQDY